MRRDALAARKRNFILFIRAAGSVRRGKRAPRAVHRMRKGEREKGWERVRWDGLEWMEWHVRRNVRARMFRTHSWVLTSNYYTSSSRTRLLDTRGCRLGVASPAVNSARDAMKYSFWLCVCFRFRSVKPFACATLLSIAFPRRVFFSFHGRCTFLGTHTWSEYSKTSVYFFCKEPAFNTFLVLFSNYLVRRNRV